MIPPLAPCVDLAPNVQEEAVVIEVSGIHVVGNVTVPANPAEIGIVAVHGWSGYRHGPHGLLTWLCRELAGRGFPTLRFDFRGRGESGGSGLDASLPSMADDLVAAADWFRETHHLKGIVYLGLCSGGNVAVGSLKRLPDTRGLILLSVYPFSDGDAFGRDVHRTWHYAQVYLHKAMHPDTWRRLVKGDVHLLQVLNVLFGHFLKRGRNQQKEQHVPGASTNAAPGKTAAPTARESRETGAKAPTTHLANLRRHIPALMVYGSADPDAPAAQTYYGDYAREHGLPIRFDTLEGANHNFSSMAWKKQLLCMIDDFLGDNCPRSTGMDTKGKKQGRANH